MIYQLKYLKFNSGLHHRLKLFWVPVNYPFQPVNLDPYFLGLWLGDGNKDSPVITTIDQEIADYLLQFSKDENVKLNKYVNKKNIPRYSLVKFPNDGSSHPNFVLNKLKKLNLLYNKHIPLIYKTNSREIRLKVLAGFIDTDGYFGNGCYEIVQKLKVLADDIQDICRSLGYACFVTPCKKGCMYKGTYREGTYYRVKFYGNTVNEIPVLLARKKAPQRLQIKDPLVTGFKIVPKGVGTYYGFCIDGNRRFLLGSHMVTHNTAISVYLSIKLGLKTMILSHLDIVKQQWGEAFEEFGGQIKTQFIKNNVKLDPTADVYIVGIQKANLMDTEDFNNIGTVIIDEAHIITVTTFTHTMFKFRPRYLIGLSATPDRADGLHTLFYPFFGKNFIVRKEKKEFTVYTLTTQYQPRIKYVYVQGKRTVDWNTVVKSIEENEERWQLIVTIVHKHPDHKIIVLCNRKVMSTGIYELLMKQGEDAELLIHTKKTWNKEARVLVAGFKKGGVGLNDPKLTMAIIASDTKDVRQYEGRIRTVNNIIYHIVDDYPAFYNHYKCCEKWYLEKGATIKTINKI